MGAPSKMASVVELARAQGVLRARDLQALDAPRAYLSRLVEQGDLVQLARGVYAPAKAELPVDLSLLEVCHCAPRAVITLLSALRYHRLGTENPWEVWIALPRGHWRPRIANLRVEVTWLDAGQLDVDVERRIVNGVEFRVFSPARTIVECFRFRGRVGLEPPLDALRDFLRRAPGDVHTLHEIALRRRAWNLMRPYVEALA